MTGVQLGKDIVIGIDLGTTNSCAAVVVDGRPEVLGFRNGKATIPSVAALGPDGGWIVGDDALARAAAAPEATIVGGKRLLGRTFDSPIVEMIRGQYAYPIVPGPRGEVAIRVGGRVLGLEVVAAEILKEVRRTASLQLGTDVRRAVIAAPAHFSERQKDSVRAAGELAGLRVERVLSEPTAAALSFDPPGSQVRRTCVYDLGGGTFDVSLLEVRGTSYEVRAGGGDAFLGGLDFDAAVAQLLVEKLREAGRAVREDAATFARLLGLAERAKCGLSDRSSVLVYVPNDHLRSGEGAELVLRREEVEARVAPLTELSLDILRDVLARARIAVREVDDVLLVGGMTRFPLVRRRVGAFFGREPRGLVHPDWAVALGAAKFGASLGTPGRVRLIDRLPLSIGIALPGGRFERVIPRDAPLPQIGTYALQTTRARQREMDIVLFQGEHEDALENEPLGVLEVRGLPAAPAGHVSVLVRLAVDEQGVLEARATESRSGSVIEARVGTLGVPPTGEGSVGPRSVPDREALARRVRDRPKSVWNRLREAFSS